MLQGRGKGCEATAVLQGQVKGRVGQEVCRARWVTRGDGNMDGAPAVCVLKGKEGRNPCVAALSSPSGPTHPPSD